MQKSYPQCRNGKTGKIELYTKLFTLSTDFSTPGKTLSEKGFPHYAPVFPQGANAVLHRNRKVNIIYIM